MFLILNGCAFFRLTRFSFPTCQYDTRIAGTLQSPARLHPSPSRLYHMSYRLIGDSIIAGNFSQLFALVNAMKNDWPCSSGYFPTGIIRSWPALRKRRCIRQVTVRVSVHEEIISTWEKLCEGDACQGRPMARSPSVPVRFRDHAQDSCRVLGMSFSSFNYERRCVLSHRRFLPALARLSLRSHTPSPGRHCRFLLCIRTRQQRECRSSFSFIILEQLYQGASTLVRCLFVITA
jgi:hypothetical protein